MANKLLATLSWPDVQALKALERKAHKWAEDSCNYDVGEATETRRHNIIMRDLVRIFGKVPDGFMLNGDPRGYALKIDPEKGGDVVDMVKDWGGYGLLAHADNFTHENNAKN